MADVVVLAFSGGLDTCYCVVDLKQQGFEVHTAFVDTGGVDSETRADIANRAQQLGVTRHHEIDGSAQLWDSFVVPLVWSHARMLGEYPLLCSDRYLIVKHCLALCDALGTRNFAHGCTGMGNDQMRFDQTVRSLGDYSILAPIRDLQSSVTAVRDHELAVLAQQGIAVDQAVSKYSINENLLGVTISGSEIDTFGAPATDVWRMTHDRENWPDQSLRINIGFEKGVACSIDGEVMSGPELLQTLNTELARWGVGRHIYTGDVTIGLKGRIAFECPGIDGLIMAHQALEDCTHTRFQNQFKARVAERWAELVYSGFYYEPHKVDLEAYLASSQAFVSGTVTLVSDGGNLRAEAVSSGYIVQNPKAIYAQTANWTPQEAEGFIKLSGQSSVLARSVRAGAGGVCDE